eukprot:g39462.t1
MGLTLNTRKLKVLHQPGLALWSKPPIIKVHREALKNLENQYLGSVLSAKATMDENQHCLQSASAAFSRLRERVFKNDSIRFDTKIIVYRALVVPDLQSCSKIQTVYCRHLKALQQYHQCCLCKILQIHWQESCTNTSILNQAEISGTEALTTLDQLQWAGHVSCMNDMRLSKQMLHSQLRNG